MKVRFPTVELFIGLKRFELYLLSVCFDGRVYKNALLTKTQTF